MKIILLPTFSIIQIKTLSNSLHSIPHLSKLLVQNSTYPNLCSQNHTSQNNFSKFTDEIPWKWTWKWDSLKKNTNIFLSDMSY